MISPGNILTSTPVNTDFREWACSLSGCDGGDPSAPIWLSGIEWGYSKKRGQSEEEYEAAITKYYIDELPHEMKRGSFTPSNRYDWPASLSYRFGISTAKLYMAINGFDVEDYPSIEDRCEDTRLFKANLYPIPFRFTRDYLWDEFKLSETTGLASKEAYRVWCILNRFPAIATEVRKHAPELIVCTGITCVADFFACFAGGGPTENINVGKLISNSSAGAESRRFYWSIINEGRTILAVVPFFSGRYGLNSNSLLQDLGSQLAVLRSDSLSR